MVRKHDGRPPYQRIAAELRALIRSGDLAPGVQLPSTQQLVEQYGAANTTIQKALGMLKAEGFLRSRMGKGVYVDEREPLVVEARSYLTPAPHGYSYRLIEVTQAPAPADVAAALGIATGEVAVLRNRLMLHDDEPVELSWSYYPVEIAVGSPLAQARRIPGGAPSALAQLGHPQRRFVDRLSVRPPTSEEVEALELPDDVPVIRQFRTVFTDRDRPVEVSVMIKGGHRYELTYAHTIN